MIDRSPEEVWSVIADLDTHTMWRPSVREFRQVSDGPLSVGSRIREVLEWRGREIVIDDVVTVFEPPRRLDPRRLEGRRLRGRLPPRARR